METCRTSSKPGCGISRLMKWMMLPARMWIFTMIGLHIPCGTPIGISWICIRKSRILQRPHYLWAAGMIWLRDVCWRDYAALRNAAGSEAARNPRLIVGPWMHGAQVGDRDFGESADVWPLLIPEMFNWNDYWLRGLGTLPEKPVRIFVMGINQWRDEEDWPLARAVYKPFYLHSGGNANTVAGDGVLDEMECAAEESVDAFVYDPANPVPSIGGCFMGKEMGPRKQQEIENRADVLVYTSAPLSSNLEVTGPVKMALYAATSGEDTDFTARLCDVYPDGTSINIVEGIVRGRFREEGDDTPLVPGKVYRFDIDLWATSNVFLEGHRLRIQISSSNFPQFDRNPNLYGPFAQQTEYITANQTVYHDIQYPSHILLPLIMETASTK